MYINEKNEEKFGVWINGKRNRWLEEDDVNTLKSGNDSFYEEIINFNNEKYMFRKEKMELEFWEDEFQSVDIVLVHKS